MTTPERIALADAIQSYHDAVASVSAAQLTLQQAVNLQSELLAQRREYELLDSEMADARAQHVKAALANDERPVLDEAPVGFSARRIARDNILTELGAVTESIGVLETELEQAKQHAAQCDLEREWAAERVLVKDSRLEIAESFDKQLLELRRVAYMLNALAIRQVRRPTNHTNSSGQFYGQGQTRRVELAPVVLQAIEESIIGSHERRNGFSLRTEAMEAAASHWASLQNDPDAQLLLSDAPSIAPTLNELASRSA